MSIIRIARVCAITLSIAIGGCAGRTPALVGSDSVKIAELGKLPEPSRRDLSSASRPYLIGPFDKLRVDVFGAPDLSRDEVQADASGRISVPLIGVLEAAGKTPQELAALITTRLRSNYVRNPQVIVNLKETVSQVVTVDGEVREPGLYPVFGKMTLMRAVATAKGASEFAQLGNVVVFRTVDGQRYAALYNLRAIRQGSYDDPEIFANDIVVVGDNQARRIFRDALAAVPALVSPLFVLLSR